jgi:hypothetical protein
MVHSTCGYIQQLPPVSVEPAVPDSGLGVDHWRHKRLATTSSTALWLPQNVLPRRFWTRLQLLNDTMYIRRRCDIGEVADLE